MMKDKTSKEEQSTKTKKYSLTKQERSQIESLQAVLQILNIQTDALQNKIKLEIYRAKVRLEIDEKDAPEGYTRSVDFDPNTYEMLVRDTKIVPEEKGNAPTPQENT